MSARDGRMATNGHTGNESLRLTRVRGVPLAGEALGIGLYHSNARTAARNSAMCTALMTVEPAVSVASV